VSVPPAPTTDPTWYRIRYSLAAQRLHAASVGARGLRLDDLAERAEVTDLPDATRAAFHDIAHLARALSEGMFGLQGSAERPGSLGTDFADAEAEALSLLTVTTRILSRSGWRWVGCRPSRFARRWARLRWRWARLRRRLARASRRLARSGRDGEPLPPLADQGLAEFLAGVVEPAAVVLFWSARIGQEYPPVIKPEGGGDRPLDRKVWSGEGGDPWQWLYLNRLLAREWPRMSRRRRVLTALGLSRFSQPSPPSYRVDYNLACLLSRMLASRRGGSGDWNRSELLEAAEFHLQRSLDAIAGGRRRRVARWAWEDPGLVGLQDEEDGVIFRRIVGPRPSEPLA
jgi:hypothetical protein